jgi:hypothetical protein
MAMIILQIKVPRDSSLPINRGAKQETKWAKLRRKCRERERERERRRRRRRKRVLSWEKCRFELW